MTNTNLQKFIVTAYEQANLVNGYNAYIGYKEQLDLIKLAKYYRKLLLNTEEPAFTINCLDENIGELINLSITRKHSLLSVILLLVAKDHYFTLQQIKIFLKDTAQHS